MNSKVNYKALILAAGRGSRLGKIGEDRPKCLVELSGKPLLEWQLKAIRESRINQIAIVTGFKGEQLSRPEITYFSNPRWSETNMLRSLFSASSWFDSPVIVSYSDIVYGHETLNPLINCNDDIAIVYDKDWLKLWKLRFENPLDDAESFRISDAGKLIEIGNKPLSTNEIQGQYMGLLRISPNGLNIIKKITSSLKEEEIDKLHMTGLLNLCINNKIPIAAYPNFSTWFEVDSESDLNIYQKVIKNSNFNGDPSYKWLS
jgi:choline kinase